MAITAAVLLLATNVCIPIHILIDHHDDTPNHHECEDADLSAVCDVLHHADDTGFAGHTAADHTVNLTVKFSQSQAHAVVVDDFPKVILSETVKYCRPFDPSNVIYIPPPTFLNASRGPPAV